MSGASLQPLLQQEAQGEGRRRTFATPIVASALQLCKFVGAESAPVPDTLVLEWRYHYWYLLIAESYHELICHFVFCNVVLDILDALALKILLSHIALNTTGFTVESDGGVDRQISSFVFSGRTSLLNLLTMCQTHGSKRNFEKV